MMILTFNDPLIDFFLSFTVNRINSIVYAVDGGMEDWMYAAGWDKSLLRQDCLGKKATGGPSYSRFLQSVTNATSFLRTRQLTEKATRQQDSSAAMPLDGNRALVFLVETSDAKTPAESSLGGGQEVNRFILFLTDSFYENSCLSS